MAGISNDSLKLSILLSEIGVTKPLTTYENALPSTNPVDIFRCSITEELTRITQLDSKLIYEALDWTSTLEKGDLLLAVPRLRLAKGIKPEEKASSWAAEFSPNPLLKTTVATGIYLRFEYSPSALPSIVTPMILNLGPKYGLNPSRGLREYAGTTDSNSVAQRRKVLIEFSSPNIAKNFHAGHLRSTIIGGFLSNLYEGAGWEVIRMNYLGDWGRQYGLLAIGWKRYGNEEIFKADPIAHLYDVYVKINVDFKPEEDEYKAALKRGENTAALESQGLLGEAKNYFKRMENGDKEALTLWQQFRDISIEKYKKTYARLNIHFSVYSGESQVKKETMEMAEKLLLEKGIAEIDQGATIIDFRKHGVKKLEVAVLRNRNGTSTYLLRDVGAAIQRDQIYGMDKMIYVVMSEQEVHLQRLFKILELMGGIYQTLSTKLQHVTFGKVMGMSTRKGTVKFLDDILADVGESMHEVMRKNEDKYRQVLEPAKIADILGLSGVMVQDMSGKRINNYPFNLTRLTSFEGDTGPYLQYAHARLCSISRKANISTSDLRQADFSLLKESHAIDLVRLMAQYPDIVTHTFKTLEPTTVLTYLFRLTHQLSSSYDVLRVVGAIEGHSMMVARAALYEAARQVIYNGMLLLGLTPVERM